MLPDRFELLAVQLVVIDKERGDVLQRVRRQLIECFDPLVSSGVGRNGTNLRLPRGVSTTARRSPLLES
jgi:hypothetical protein